MSVPSQRRGRNGKGGCMANGKKIAKKGGGLAAPERAGNNNNSLVHYRLGLC